MTGNPCKTVKEAKNKVMQYYMAYLALLLAGKWNRQTSFLTQEFNSEDTTIRFESERFKPKQ